MGTTTGNPRGRPHGSKNKKTAERITAAEMTGEMPVEYMLRVMRDVAADYSRRDEMAKAAAPYLHARLGQIEAPKPVNDIVPLHERLAAYAREELIEGSNGKVIELLPPPKAKDCG